MLIHGLPKSSYITSKKAIAMGVSLRFSSAIRMMVMKNNKPRVSAYKKNRRSSSLMSKQVLTTNSRLHRANRIMITIMKQTMSKIRGRVTIIF